LDRLIETETTNIKPRHECFYCEMPGVLTLRKLFTSPGKQN